MPAAARQGDSGVPHCSAYTIASGSGDVLINGRGAARVGDTSTTHKKPGGRRCGSHAAAISSGSGSVFINGRAAARVGDSLSSCTSISSGSGDVIIG